MGLKSIVLSSVLFVLLVLSPPLTTNVSALGPSSPLRPEWLMPGDYVTYLYSVTALGVTETIHVKSTVLGDKYLNNMDVQRFGEQTSPNFPASLGHLSPTADEGHLVMTFLAYTFLTTEDEVASTKPVLEQVRGLNNRTYEAYKMYPGIDPWYSDSCNCNFTVWYEKETLVKIKVLEWWVKDGMDVRSELLIEDSSIQGLAASPNTTSTPAKTLTVTIFVTPPRTIVTTTTTLTVTTTVTGSKTAETITITETKNGSENTTAAAAIPISAGILVAGAIVSIVLLKKRVS